RTRRGWPWSSPDGNAAFAPSLPDRRSRYNQGRSSRARGGTWRVSLLDVLLAAIIIVVAYFLGTIPSGYLVAKVRGVNIQQVGSGNIGATNVLRALGVVPAIIVVILDPLKGALATLLPSIAGLGPWVTALAGLAAVLGNDFNVLLRMKGGKGIATSI